MIRALSHMRELALGKWGLTISGIEVVDVCITEGATSHGIAANTNA
jgi:hypothetical protein